MATCTRRWVNIPFPWMLLVTHLAHQKVREEFRDDDVHTLQRNVLNIVDQSTWNLVNYIVWSEKQRLRSLCTSLVGGFKPSEKYLSNWIISIISPNRDEFLEITSLTLT